MQKKLDQIINIIEASYFSLILIFTHWHNYFMARSYPRWLHLTPYYFGIGGLSLVIVISCLYKSYIADKWQRFKNMLKQWKFWLILGIIAEVHVVNVIELIQGKSYIFHVLDFLVYDVILLTVFMMSSTQEETHILQAMKWMSLTLVGFAIYGWIDYAANGFTDRMYAGMDNPQTTGVMFLIGFWLPSVSRKEWIKAGTKILFALSIILTWQRSVWCGLFFSLLIYILINGKSMWERRRLVFLIPLTAGIIILLLIPTTRNMLLNRINPQNLLFSTEERLYPQKEVIKHYINEAGMIERIFGNGYDTVEDWEVSREVRYSGGEIACAVDNQFLKLLFEFGLIGTILYIAWFIYGIKLLRSGSKKVRIVSIIAVAMLLPSLFYDILTRGMIPCALVIISGIMLDSFLSPDRSNPEEAGKRS